MADISVHSFESFDKSFSINPSYDRCNFMYLYVGESVNMKRMQVICNKYTRYVEYSTWCNI